MPSSVENLQKIEHIVVLMMENRSFDHILGFLSIDDGRADVDGLTSGLANDANGTQYKIHKATSTKLVKAQDPCHSGWCVDEQVAGGMSGFASNYAKTRKQQFPGDTSATVMAYHTGAQLPVYAYLAREFCVCDRWFCSVPGATMPNRCYAVAGRAQGSRDNIRPPIYHLNSFVRHLDRAAVSWRWYAHDEVPMLWMIDPLYALGHLSVPAYFDRQEPLGPRSFLQAAAAGTLPAVSWIDPNFIDVNFGPEGSNDDHPPSDLQSGQDLVLKLFHGIARSPLWPTTLLVVTYDEHGGFYDHVAPKAAEDDDPTFRRYGPRVPALVVSPWVNEREVSHTPFDHTSIIKTILLRFCQRNDGTIPDMGARVHAANDLGHVLTAETPRPAPPQSDYQPLIDDISRFHATLLQRAMQAQAEGTPPPTLTDFQEDFLAAKQELLAMRVRAAATAPLTMIPDPPPTQRPDL
jgi:phospholipase C